eukprot:1138869-Pyramimonas_sp.AAC.1
MRRGAAGVASARPGLPAAEPMARRQGRRGAAPWPSGAAAAAADDRHGDRGEHHPLERELARPARS